MQSAADTANTQPSIIGEKHQFSALDALRGVAAISVMLFHYATVFDIPFFPHAYLAVDFFFALSGFVIAHAYEERLIRGMTFKNFMARRLIRLYPLYFLPLATALIWVFVAGLFHVAHEKRSLTIIDFAAGLFFIPLPPKFSAGGWGIFALNGPSWSLSLEIFVNVIYAALSKLFGVRYRKVILATSLAVIVFAIVHYGNADIGGHFKDYMGGWARIFWSFFLGLFLYSVFKKHHFRLLNPILTIALASALLLVFAASFDSIIYDIITITVIMPAIVYAGAHVRAVTNVGRKIMNILGTSSYALYIVHMPWLSVLYHTFGPPDATMGTAERYVLTIAWGLSALVFAIAMDMFYDIPIRRVLTRKLGNRNA